MTKCMINCIITPFSMLFQLYCRGQCTYPCFSGILFTSTLHNMLSKPLAAFPYNHCQNNREWQERNESSHNDYNQSMERTLAKPGDRTSDLFSATLMLLTELWSSAKDKMYLISQWLVSQSRFYRSRIT